MVCTPIGIDGGGYGITVFRKNQPEPADDPSVDGMFRFEKRME